MRDPNMEQGAESAQKPCGTLKPDDLMPVIDDLKRRAERQGAAERFQ